MPSQRFSASQVCQIVTGEYGDMDYLFPGSDDDMGTEDMDDLEWQGDSESETCAEMDQVGGNSFDVEDSLPPLEEEPTAIFSAFLLPNCLTTLLVKQIDMPPCVSQ